MLLLAHAKRVVSLLLSLFCFRNLPIVSEFFPAFSLFKNACQIVGGVSGDVTVFGNDVRSPIASLCKCYAVYYLWY